MNSTASWDHEEPETTGETPLEGESPTSVGGNITSLRELTFRLLRKVESIGEAQTPDIENGIDFYGEVSRFEIDLIKRALIQTGGHQRRAARLLNLKVTTLNSKIKHYNISLIDRAYSYPISGATEIEETRRRA
ncbi:MAG TPA: helix-turn-helix domain-containing protein [Pyrinomonadaceae bacterium]|nr:helix-turn-helix domain-containing protein [Pyrinomonadaceae bacterium]